MTRTNALSKAYFRSARAPDCLSCPLPLLTRANPISAVQGGRQVGCEERFAAASRRTPHKLSWGYS